MRYYILIITLSLLVTKLLFGQTISGESKAALFKIPVENKPFSSYSNPTEFRIRQGVLLSNTSEPTAFIIRQNKAGLDNRTIKPSELALSSIPEIENGLPKYYSLIIGIDDYSFNNSRLQDLSKAVSDAKNLHNTLTKDFSFQSENAILLENPNRQQVIQHLESLAAKISPKDNLLIFYAGHGIWDERIRVGYWLPSDAKSDDKSSWISNSTIRDYIAGINSKHTLLITDACFSGSIFKTRDMDLSDYGMSNLYRLSSRKAMTSGTLTTVPDESKFMHYFIKRLNDTEGKYISARQVFFGLETAVVNNTSTVPQFGVIQDAGDEGGDFIFIRKK
jgi:hypothetical protein